MQVVCEATQSEDIQAKVAALQCLVKIMSLYYQDMEAYMAQVFNLPVFWPILVMYFITLFCITMKRQIKVLILFNCFLILVKRIMFTQVIHWHLFLQHMIRFR